MTTAFIGQPVNRVDGRQKVTGGAAYAAEFEMPDSAHAAIVRSTIAKGRITSIDTAEAERATGVLAVLTHRNGRLAAILHEGHQETSTYEEFSEALLDASRFLHACPTVATRHRIAPMNVHTPTCMRAPGEASGVFALESAMDELAVALSSRSTPTPRRSWR